MTGSEHLMALGEELAEQFRRSKPQRVRHRHDYPTQIGVFDCMDGRVSLPCVTGTLPGIIQSWSNIGVRFDLFHWFDFQESVKGLWRWTKGEKERRHSLPLLFVVMDHTSRNHRHLRCKGHLLDDGRALASSRALIRQFEDVFCGDPDVYTIHATLETDEDALMFHGKNGKDMLDLGLGIDLSREDISVALRKLYPNMSREPMLNDLTEIAWRNLGHSMRMRQSNRVLLENDHREWILYVGQGFEFPETNMALSVGPFDPNFSENVRIAAEILASNLNQRDFDRHRGAVLMASAPFRPEEGSVGKKIAAIKARHLADRALGAIRDHVPDLRPYLKHLTVTVNMEDRRLAILDGD